MTCRLSGRCNQLEWLRQVRICLVKPLPGWSALVVRAVSLGVICPVKPIAQMNQLPLGMMVVSLLIAPLRSQVSWRSPNFNLSIDMQHNPTAQCN